MPRKDYVIFSSPGSFVSEQTCLPVKDWGVKVAVGMAKDVKERYDAKPYGFQFITMLEAAPVLDEEGGTLKVQGREVERSGMFFLGGEVLTYDDIVAKNNTRDEILLSNMRSNDYPVVVENNNSWRVTLPFGENDCVVHPETGDMIMRGDAADLVEYRQQINQRWEEEDRLQREQWAREDAAQKKTAKV